jgi:flagellar hook assembly protein FlgD
MKSLVFALLLVSSSSFAQGVDSLLIQMSDGRRVAIALQDISKITFDSTLASVSKGEMTFEPLVAHAPIPNPFSSQTAVRFTVRESRQVHIRVYDLLGREVYTKTVIATAGQNEVVWTGQTTSGQMLSPGLYRCSLETTGFIASTMLHFLPR